MKPLRPSHYLRLLAYEPRTMSIFLLAGIFLGIFQVRLLRHSDTMLPFMSLMFGVVFSNQFLASAFPFLFKAPVAGMKTAYNISMYGEMEFLFTRAIPRRSLFYARTTRYLAACILPFLIVWGSSLAAPPVKMEINSFDPSAAEMEHFYLDHFPDAFAETLTLSTKDKITYAVLPHGQANFAFFNVAFICLIALLNQLMVFIFWQKRWSLPITIIALTGAPLLLIGWIEYRVKHAAASFSEFYMTPEAYKSSLIWVTAHPFLTLSLLVLLAVVTELYSCQRYIKTEPA